MAKDVTEYRDDVFSLINQIGAVVGKPVQLYRWVNRSWQVITLRSLPDIGHVYNYNDANHGRFMVAPEGSAGHQSIGIYYIMFSIAHFPGCCAFGVSTGAGTHPDWRNRGLNRLGIQLRIALAGYAGYKGLVCTDITRNTPSIRTIEGAGFKKLTDTVNKRTGNTVNLYFKELE